MTRKSWTIVLGAVALIPLAVGVLIPLAMPSPIEMAYHQLREGMPQAKAKRAMDGFRYSSAEFEDGVPSPDKDYIQFKLGETTLVMPTPLARSKTFHCWESGERSVTATADDEERIAIMWFSQPPSKWQRFKDWAGWGPKPTPVTVPAHPAAASPAASP